ncbi:MAG: ATP-binding protein [Bacteroidia bacterium]
MKFEIPLRATYRLIFLCLVFLLCSANNLFSIQIKQGAYNFKQIGNIGNRSFELNGQWEFYYHATYADVKSKKLKPEYLNVPGVWNELGHPAHGYGTYRLTLFIDHKQDSLLALHAFAMSTDYNFYVNGRLRGKAGKFDTLAEKNVPDYNPQYFVFYTRSDTVEIVFEVANFDYKKGGIWYFTTIGSPERILKNKEYVMYLSTMFIGAMLIMFFYQFLLFFTNRFDRAVMHFSLFCLMLAVRLATTGEIPVRQMEVPVSWEWLVRLEFISLFMMIGFGGKYFHHFFPKESSLRFSNWIFYANILISAFALFAPISVSCYVIPPYLLFAAFQLFYYLTVIIRAVVRKRDHAILMLTGFVVIFITGINDMLYSQELIISAFVVPYAAFSFVLIQAIIINKRFATALNTVEALSKNLVEANATLQEKVDLRTKELNEEKCKLEQSNTIKDKLFSIIAHDIRGPMITLKDLFDLLKEDKLDFDETKLFIRSIRKNVEGMTQMIENLLQWSRSQMGGIFAMPEIIDVRQRIDWIVELYLPVANEKGLTLKNEITSDDTIYIDSNHFDLIIRNLIANSIKFTKKGGTVSVNTNSSNPEHVEITVADTGIGIQKEKLDMIFKGESYYTTFGTSNEKGTGIGLMICKEFTEKSGGKLFIESEENKGTTVRVIFKRK